MHEAFAAALGPVAVQLVPGNPRPWLISTARFKAIDTLTLGQDLTRPKTQLVRYLEAQSSSAERSNARGQP